MYPLDGANLIFNLPVAKFVIPGWGDKVNSAIGLSYRPARLHIGVGGGGAGVNYILQAGTMNLATGRHAEFLLDGNGQISNLIFYFIFPVYMYLL